jgi:putative transposase
MERIGTGCIGSLTADVIRRRLRRRRVAVDVIAVKIKGEQSWLYASIDVDTKLILDVTLFGRHGTDPAVAFLHGLTEKNDCSEAVFLVNKYDDYWTGLSRVGLSSRVNCI